MMKCVFVMVLLQVCYSSQLNMNLNNEILQDLREIRGNVKLPNSTAVPGFFMKLHPSLCVGTFSKELRKLLSNVTQEKPVGILLQKLESNLALLGRHQQQNTNCTTTSTSTTGMKPSLNPYINFIRRLNNRK